MANLQDHIDDETREALQQIAEAQQSVGIVGRLFVSPPVLAVVAIARYLSSPETSVVGVGEGFGMSCESRLLPLQELQQPALRLDVCDEAFLEGKLGPHGKAGNKHDGQ